MNLSFLSLVLLAGHLSISSFVLAQDQPAGTQQPGRPAGPAGFFALGAAASGGQVEFRGGTFQINAFPFINFKKGRFYSNQAGIGYEAFKNDTYRLSVVTEVGVNEQNRNDVDPLNDMENLGLPIYGGLSLDVNVADFVLTGTIQRELGFASEGWRAFAAVSLPYKVSEKLTVSPSITVQWSDSRLTNYLYGVRADDIQPNRSLYETGDSFHGNAGVTGVYRLSNKVTLIGSGGMNWYGDSIVDSPIVDRRTAFSMFLAVGYAF